MLPKHRVQLNEIIGNWLESIVSDENKEYGDLLLAEETSVKMMCAAESVFDVAIATLNHANRKKRGLAKRAPDAGDSAASQTLSPQSGESSPEVYPAATQRR